MRSYRLSGRMMKYLNAVAASKSKMSMPRTASAIGSDSLSRWRNFFVPDRKDYNIANSQRIRGNSIPLQSYAAMIFIHVISEIPTPKADIACCFPRPIAYWAKHPPDDRNVSLKNPWV